MRIAMHGRGHETPGGLPHHRPEKPFINVGVFRRGGLGDGFIESAIITAIKRAIPNANITGYADQPFYKLLVDHPACSSVRGVAWSQGMYTEVQVRNATIISDGVDLWFDVKPIPFVEGRNRERYINTDHLGELADIESRYYRFNADEIIDLYRRHGCQGQPQLISKLLGVEASIRDAHIPWEGLPNRLVLPVSYATISAGWTETSHYKGWTTEGWTEVARWLSSLGICPVQVGTEDEREIPGTLSVRTLNLQQQMGVIRGAKLHLGSDGFLCHVASAADIPTIVLWGPTPPEVWGHPGQLAIVSPIARNLWWTHYHWAHDPACQEMMRAIEPDAVIEGIGRMLGGHTLADRPESSFPADHVHCVVGQVQGGFGDGLMSMSKLKSLVQPGKRTIVLVIPDGNGDFDNVRRSCAMFSFVDDVIVEMGLPLHPEEARRLIEGRDDRLVVDEFFDLRYAEISSIDAPVSKLSIHDLRNIPTLPEWLPTGDICCIQPATRDHKDENAVWPDYWRTMEMVEDVIGIPVVLIGGPADLPHITKEPRLGVNAIGRLTFEEAFVLVATSLVGVAMDSWVAHCAGAFGKTSVYIHCGTTLAEFLSFVTINDGDILMVDAPPEDICDAIRKGIVRRSR